MEFIAYAKANKGKVTFASSGTRHLRRICRGELFKRMAGIEMTARALSRRRAGAQRPHARTRRRHVQQHRRGAAAGPGRQAARARGDHRQADSGGAATCRPIAESGVPGFDVSSWFAFFVPAKTPPDDHPEDARRHRRRARRAADQSEARAARRSTWSARRRRSLRPSQGRDGKMGRRSSRRPASRPRMNHGRRRIRSREKTAMISRRRLMQLSAASALAPGLLGRAALRASAKLAQPSRPPDRAVPAGRRRRHDRPPHRRAALRDLGPASGDREPGRRRRQSRGRGRRPFRSRRLHHVPRGRLSGDQPLSSTRSSATIRSPTSCRSRSSSSTPSSWWCRTPRRRVRSRSSSPTPRRTPERSRFASPGHGTAPHLAAELFKRTAGIDLMHVPYRGAAPAIQDLIPGRVDFVLQQCRPGGAAHAAGPAARARA